MILTLAFFFADEPRQGSEIGCLFLDEKLFKQPSESAEYAASKADPTRCINLCLQVIIILVADQVFPELSFGRLK